MLLKHRKYRAETIKDLKEFLLFCNQKISQLPPRQQKLMYMYMVYADRVLTGKPISDLQVTNLLYYRRYKMRERKKCPFTKNYCLSDFPQSVKPKECLDEGICILLR